MVIGISLTVLTAVAGLGLAILNAISFAQRRDEVGILYAMGHNRAKLVARALRENVSIMILAWLTGAAICIAGMFYAQATLYAPLGTSIDWSNLTPWLFTLPLPIAVVAAGAGTVTWALHRLDPVAIIERR
jgi:ABC-type antimicrobial peptide transport system permease subunit